MTSGIHDTAEEVADIARARKGRPRRWWTSTFFFLQNGLCWDNHKANFGVMWYQPSPKFLSRTMIFLQKLYGIFFTSMVVSESPRRFCVTCGWRILQTQSEKRCLSENWGEFPILDWVWCSKIKVFVFQEGYTSHTSIFLRSNKPWHRIRFKQPNGGISIWFSSRRRALDCHASPFGLRCPIGASIYLAGLPRKRAGIVASELILGAMPLTFRDWDAVLSDGGDGCWVFCQMFFCL